MNTTRFFFLALTFFSFALFTEANNVRGLQSLPSALTNLLPDGSAEVTSALTNLLGGGATEASGDGSGGSAPAPAPAPASGSGGNGGAVNIVMRYTCQTIAKVCASCPEEKICKIACQPVQIILC